MHAQPADPVTRQFEAYNRHDLEGFVACYTPEAVIEDGAGKVLMRGHDEMRTTYRNAFEASPNLRAEVVTRIRIGEYVVDEEALTGRVGSPEHTRAVVIYHIHEDLIDHVRFIR